MSGSVSERCLQETPLVVSFESANYRVLEGEEVRVNVVVTPAPDRELTIPITVAPYARAGAPAEEGDYTVQGLGAGGVLTFGVGDAVETFVIRAEEDNTDNRIEDVALDCGSLPSGVTSARLDKILRALLRILDNDWKATLSKRENWPPERYFLALPFTDPEGDELKWWLDGPDGDDFLVEPFHQGGSSYGLFFLGWDTVWDSDVKDTYTFIFYLSDNRDEDGDPDGGLPDHRGVLVVTVTPGPEIVLQPASVPAGTETEVRISLSRFLPANDQVTISVSGQCGMDGTLGVTGGGTLSITTDGDGAANVVVPFTAGAFGGDTRCEVVAAGSVVPTGSVENDTAAATLVVLGNRPTETTAYTLSAQDSEGAPLGDFPVTVTVLPRPGPPTNRSPTVTASCDPYEVAPGGEVRLSATASDPDGDPLTYAWSAPQGSFDGATDAATARWTAPAQTGRVTVRVKVSDGQGGSASADVTVQVTNRLPAFEQSTYRFELAENLDGSRRPVEIGRATAEDPEGAALTYDLVSDAGERFAMRSGDGVVTYVGPGEDFETEPNRFDLTARVRDAFGAEARAQVVVTVTNVNERPAAVDDEAETTEDRMVAVDVLANDTDPDGDRLRVASVSAAAHGTATVTAGGTVTYTPEADYHGADRFTYVVSDGGGATATATVDMTVLPSNDAPVAVGVIPDQVLDEGGGPVTVDLTPFFDDPDGDALTFRAASSDTDIATVTVVGAALTLTPVALGAASVTVTAEDPGGLTATQTFAAGVSDRLVRAVLGNTREYRNEPGHPAAAITDAAAFPRDCGAEPAPAAVLTAVAGSDDGECPGSTLCLQDGRYEVTVGWSTLDGREGSGRAVRAGTRDSGLFHFFHPSNWEMLVKVLDGCSFNGHHWVFAAAATDVGLKIEVTDTATGASRRYTKPAGEPARAVTDLAAFPQGCSSE